MSPAPDVRLFPLGLDEADRVAHLEVTPEHERYAGRPAAAFTAAEDGVDLHAIARAGDAAVIGFFKIDRLYPWRMGFARQGDLGLRGFVIDRMRQGEGLGTAAVRALPAYLAEHYPDFPAIALTVNCANPAAIACYLNGGFSDTGQTYAGGGAGPQYVMRMALGTRPAVRRNAL